jgi:hypothetical protein
MLKCLQVTGLKVEFQGMGIRGGETENPGKENEPRRWKTSQRPHPLKNKIPKGAPPDSKARPTRQSGDWRSQNTASRNGKNMSKIDIGEARG